jgi:hypothetical protein
MSLDVLALVLSALSLLVNLIVLILLLVTLQPRRIDAHPPAPQIEPDADPAQFKAPKPLWP